MATSRTPKKTPKKSRASFIEGEFNLPQVEEKVLSYWDDRHIFEQSLTKKKGAKTFVFYEGPPYANGKPGIHHVLSRVVKDVILRYKTMQGFEVPRRAGWDTHGLPVEMAAEKALGLKSKRDIEQYGVKHFNEKAKEQVWIYKDEWERMTRRIGYWLDIKNAYVTYKPEYIESIWWTLSKIAERDLLYKGHKVVPWCTRCGTSLSSHELAQGYKEVEDRSVYVKFKLKPDQKFGTYTAKDSAYILSWTTTPWTLPGNVALAVGEKIMYTALRVKGVSELYILASARVHDVFKNPDEIEIVHSDIKGSDLVGLEYEPLFAVAPLAASPKSYKVYAADFVTTTDGTGVVHTAVMYGEDDYQLGKTVGLPEHHTVDEEGNFKKDVPALKGMYAKAKETEDAIFEHLKVHGNYLRVASYKHEYPFCWRCGTPILYYARTSWFIGMSKLRQELLANNETVNWSPAHVKAGRFGEWIREVKDWNLSRERYWGAPLPIWECKHCGHTDVISSIEQLASRTAAGKNHYWVLRHGTAAGNDFGIIDDGKAPFHLTPKGKKEVEASTKKLHRELSKKKESIDLVFSSDIMRTRESAELAADILGGKAVIYDKRLQEIHLGSSLEERSLSAYWKKFPTYEERFSRKVEGVETLIEVRTRVWEFLKECEEKYSGKNILIVSHEDPIWMMAQAAQGWTERQTIAQKADKAGRFLGTGATLPLTVKNIPRNDTGEIDLHRPFVDEIKFACTKCKEGEMVRVKEVADVWYDSGAMPYGQIHFPFGENAKMASGAQSAQLPENAFPADYISEGMDQTRGWFYTLMAISTALGYGAPYKNVVALGLINDKFGQKMSKSKGNIVEPFEVIGKYGVDAVRWYFYTSSPLGEPKNFDEGEIAKAVRRTHLIVYNSLVFWKTYADRAARLSSSIVSGATKSKNVLDAWILARLTEVGGSVTAKLDRYEIREAALEIDALVDDLSRWFIRRSRRRLQKPQSAADYKAASATLHYALMTTIKMMAPFTPFFSESLYHEVGGTMESIHLDQWPSFQKKLSVTDQKLLDSMKAVREYAALGLAKRAEAGIKVRQPLSSLMVPLKLGPELGAILAEEVNVKKITVNMGAKECALDTTITPALREEGMLRDVVRMFQELRQKGNLSPKDKIIAMIELAEEATQVVRRNEKMFLVEIGAKAVEYKRGTKFQAEEETKLDGHPAWIGLRKI